MNSRTISWNPTDSGRFSRPTPRTYAQARGPHAKISFAPAKPDWVTRIGLGFVIGSIVLLLGVQGFKALG